MAPVLHFDAHELEARLTRLPSAHRAVFAALCARRMAPVFAALCRHERRTTNPLAVLEETLWRHLAGEELQTPEALTALATAATALMPRDETAKYYAEDAAASLAYAMQAAADGNPRNARMAAQRLYESLDTYLQGIGHDASTPAGQAELVGHPIMQAELGRQAEDLADLERLHSHIELTDALRFLRDRADTDAKDFIRTDENEF